MPSDASSLSRLRHIRDQIRNLDAQREDLIEGRNVLISQAANEGLSERTIAESADLDRSRIGQIVRAASD